MLPVEILKDINLSGTIKLGVSFVDISKVIKIHISAADTYLNRYGDFCSSCATFQSIKANELISPLPAKLFKSFLGN